MIKNNKANRARGMTLVEVLVTIVLLGIVLSTVTSFFLSSNRLSILGSDQRDVQSDVRLAMDQVMQNIRYATEVKVLADMTGENTSSTEYAYVYYDTATGDLVYSVVTDGKPTGSTRTMSSDFSNISFNKVSGYPESISVTIDAEKGNQEYPLDSIINFPNLTLRNQTVTGINSGLAIKYKPPTSGAIAVTPGPTSVSVTGITLAPSTLSLSESENASLTATVQPAKASNKNVTWSTSDSTVATVANGQVTAIKTGEAIITATTVDGGYTATCSISVNLGAVQVTNVTLSPTSATVKKGNTVQLTATVLPSNATNKNVTWSSSDSKKVSVDQNGLVTGHNQNTTAYITVTTVDGDKSATCEITVTK